MREQFDLDLVSLDRFTCLFYGAFNVGKTHLLGDFLLWARDRGQQIAYVNITGEDGYASLASMGLGAVGETVSSLDDYDEVMRDYATRKVGALAVDSLPALYRLVMRALMPGHEIRYPDPKLDGDRSKMLWGQLQMKTFGRVLMARDPAPYVLWVSPYDRSEDPIQGGGGGKGLTPDLPGRLAYGCGGWFDFIGYMSADTISATQVRRQVTLAPSGGMLTRQRIPRQITRPLDLSAPRGGWATIFNAIEQEFLAVRAVSPAASSAVPRAVNPHQLGA